MKRVVSVLMLVAILMSLVAVYGAQAQMEEPILLVEQLPNQVSRFASDAYCDFSPDGQSVTDQFVVPAHEILTISKIQLWGGYTGYDGAVTYLDNFSVIFHSVTASGAPGESIYSESAVPSTREATGQSVATLPEYTYTLTLEQPQTFTAGMYWIEIYNGGGSGQNFFFMESGNPDTLGRTNTGIMTYLANEAPGVAWVEFGLPDLALRLLGYSYKLFTWSPASPKQGDVVTFTIPDGSSPAIVGWAVACDPGQEDLSCSHPLAETASATYTFDRPGDWLVRLQMYDSDYLPLDEQIQTVTVAKAPPQFVFGPAAFAWDLTGSPVVAEPSAPGQEIFVAADVQYGEEGATCTVDYGDGAGPEEGTWTYGPMAQGCQGPLHTYAAPGYYDVVMTVTNPDGLAGSATLTHEVKPDAPEVVDVLVLTPDLTTLAEPSMVGQAVVGAGLVHYIEQGATCTVDYGDGTGPQGGDFLTEGWPSICLGPTHTYATAGTYTVEVVVINSDGKTGSNSAVHEVVAPVPDTPEVSAPLIAANEAVVEPSQVGQEVYGVAYAEYSDEGATCTVDYGDGLGAQAGVMGYYDEATRVCVGPAHTYTAAGSYIVEVVVTNSNDKTGSNSAVHEVIAPASTPVLSGISPASAVTGSADLSLAVSGSSFAGSSVVRWNGADLVTTYVSESQLTAVIPAANLETARTAQVTVYTPEPGGGTSDVLAFFVTEAAAGVVGQDVASGENPMSAYGSATATATGSGLLVVAEYDANPAGTPSFTASGSYFDVYAAPGNTFTEVTITACGLTASEKLFWWDATLDKWAKADPQSYEGGCVTLVVTDSSSPSLSQLQGTYFVAGIETAVNTAPVASPGGPYLGGINTAILFDGSDSSDAEGNLLAYAWDFGDGATGSGVTPSHSYAAAGIYNVCLTVNDGTVDSDPACTLAVVYDPDGGFVTGGGWVDSPAGAYTPDPDLSGKATFGFVSKYKKGASVPTGNTEFQFHAAGFNFHSTSYDWLVVNQAGTNAQFKGSGTVNGGLAPDGSGYKFMLWAGDATPDTFRIKIWWEADGGENVVYDNGFNQAIGGGNIVVHKK